MASDALSASERTALASLLTDILSRLLRDGLLLLDADDKTPTRWGNWAPSALNDDPRWLEERGLNSLQMLSFLAVRCGAVRSFGAERARHGAGAGAALLHTLHPAALSSVITECFVVVARR
eukprot:2302689-Prymnesium_polylepis.1